MKSVINLPLNTIFLFGEHMEMLQEDYTPSAKCNKEVLSQGNGQVMANKPPS